MKTHNIFAAIVFFFVFSLFDYSFAQSQVTVTIEGVDRGINCSVKVYNAYVVIYNHVTHEVLCTGYTDLNGSMSCIVTLPESYCIDVHVGWGYECCDINNLCDGGSGIINLGRVCLVPCDGNDNLNNGK